MYVFQQASISLTSTQRICVSFGNLGCWFFYFGSLNWEIAENIPYISSSHLWYKCHNFKEITILLSGYFFPFVHNVNFHSREGMTIFSEYQYLCKSIGYFHSLSSGIIVQTFNKKCIFKRRSMVWGVVHTYKLYIHLFVSPNVCLRHCDHNIYGADNNNSTL